jgi:hypothetical protein
MSTISTQVNHGIVQGIVPYYSALTITNIGGVSNSAGSYALFGTTGTVVNNGTIAESGGSSSSDSGISLSGSGSVTNSGTISGASVGINLFAGGSITNTNSIIGSDGIGVISASGAYAAIYIGGGVALRAAANAP